MAGIEAVYSVGDSIIAFLRNGYTEAVRDALGIQTPGFRLLSSGELADESASFETSISLYLYRVSINEQLRNVRTVRPGVQGNPLALNLHYLLTVWAGAPRTEHVLLAWAMRQLHEHPLLAADSLTADGGWQPEDVIHMVPSELSNEDMMNIWETLRPAYRLSHPYVARVVQLDPVAVSTPRPVVVRRLESGPVEGSP